MWDNTVGDWSNQGGGRVWKYGCGRIRMGVLQLEIFPYFQVVENKYILEIKWFPLPCSLHALILWIVLRSI